MRRGSVLSALMERHLTKIGKLLYRLSNHQLRLVSHSPYQLHLSDMSTISAVFISLLVVCWTSRFSGFPTSPHPPTPPQKKKMKCKCFKMTDCVEHVKHNLSVSPFSTWFSLSRDFLLFKTMIDSLFLIEWNFELQEWKGKQWTLLWCALI